MRHTSTSHGTNLLQIGLTMVFLGLWGCASTPEPPPKQVTPPPAVQPPPVAKSAGRSNRVFRNEKDMAYTDGKMCLEKTCLDNEVAFYNQATIGEMTNGAVRLPFNIIIIFISIDL